MSGLVPVLVALRRHPDHPAARNAGHAFVIIDGTLIAIDRVAADRPFCSGKHHRHGMNLQVISAPDGEILWVSGPLPGAVHDLTAARIWGILRALADAGLITLADKGYIGAGQHVLVPYRGRGKPASQKAANRAHAQLRAPGEAHRQSHPRPPDPRNQRMKKAQYVIAVNSPGVDSSVVSIPDSAVGGSWFGRWTVH
jgi:hypothetical protein